MRRLCLTLKVTYDVKARAMVARTESYSVVAVNVPGAVVGGMIGGGFVAWGSAFGDCEGGVRLVLSFVSWALEGWFWVLRVEMWLVGRLARSCVVAPGERSSGCSWVVVSSLEVLAGCSSLSRPVLSRRSDWEVM